MSDAPSTELARASFAARRPRIQRYWWCAMLEEIGIGVCYVENGCFDGPPNGVSPSGDVLLSWNPHRYRLTELKKPF